MPYKMTDAPTEIDPNDYIFGQRFYLALHDYLDRDFDGFPDGARWEFNNEYEGLSWRGYASEKAQLVFKPTLAMSGPDEGRISENDDHWAQLTWWDSNQFGHQSTELGLTYRDLLEVIALAEFQYGDEPNVAQKISKVDLDARAQVTNSGLLLQASMHLQQAARLIEPGNPVAARTREIDKGRVFVSLAAESLNKENHSDDPKTASGALLKADRLLRKLTTQTGFGVMAVSEEDVATVKEAAMLVEVSGRRPSPFSRPKIAPTNDRKDESAPAL